MYLTDSISVCIQSTSSPDSTYRASKSTYIVITKGTSKNLVVTTNGANTNLPSKGRWPSGPVVKMLIFLRKLIYTCCSFRWLGPSTWELQVRHKIRDLYFISYIGIYKTIHMENLWKNNLSSFSQPKGVDERTSLWSKNLHTFLYAG